MRYLTYFTEDRHRLDITNSWLGEEKIYYDGQLVSRHSSLFGSMHEFMVVENEAEACYRILIEYKWPLRIGFDIFRNGKALLLS
ncbi:hypothetical protein [Taibaiella koreensis]|uniref:hypothetical protein n=1 Tax=Taibaiella koreensis TaxID=1268548 RepID=UPI000E5996E0|nr:hypothetical protein [Taibaiella koreensis]